MSIIRYNNITKAGIVTNVLENINEILRSVTVLKIIQKSIDEPIQFSKCTAGPARN